MKKRNVRASRLPSKTSTILVQNDLKYFRSIKRSMDFILTRLEVSVRALLTASLLPHHWQYYIHDYVGKIFFFWVAMPLLHASVSTSTVIRLLKTVGWWHLWHQRDSSHTQWDAALAPGEGGRHPERRDNKLRNLHQNCSFGWTRDVERIRTPGEDVDMCHIWRNRACYLFHFSTLLTFVSTYL